MTEFRHASACAASSNACASSPARATDSYDSARRRRRVAHQPLRKRHLPDRGSGLAADAGRCASIATAITRRNAIAVRARLAHGAAQRRRRHHAGARHGTRRRAHPGRRAPGDAAAAQRRAVRMGERRRARRRRTSHRKVRGARRGDGAHAPPFAELEAAAGVRAPRLGFRDQPRRPAALGALERRHGPRRGEARALRPHRRADRPAARTLRQGAGALRPRSTATCGSPTC